MLDIRACLIYKCNKIYDEVTFRCEQRKLSEMTKHRQLCLAVFLLFLGSVASVVPSLHVVTGTNSYNGVYQERREPELHFKRLGEADQYGDPGDFLYTDNRRPNTWILGRGDNVTTAQAMYRAPAVDGRPAITGWSYVWDGEWGERDGSRVGREEEGSPVPLIRVVGVETNITGEELTDQWNKAGTDVVTEEYIICDARGSSPARIIIFKSSKDPAYCNAVPQSPCKSGSSVNNEPCPFLIVHQNSKTFNISRKDFEAGHAKDDQNTIACRKKGDKEWVILDENACEWCNLVPDCDTDFDEHGCPVYTSPSFEYPVYCSLVVLIFGVLLHLGWNAVTR